MSSTQTTDQTTIADLQFMAKWETGGAARLSDYLRARQIRRAIGLRSGSTVRAPSEGPLAAIAPDITVAASFSADDDPAPAGTVKVT
jgi:hypothetical protein